MSKVGQMLGILASGSARAVSEGSEYDHPYYKQEGPGGDYAEGVPAQYTRDQNIEFSRIAQSLTYQDARALGAITGRVTPAQRRAQAGKYRNMSWGRSNLTGKMSSQHLHDFLKFAVSDTKQRQGIDRSMQRAVSNRASMKNARNKWELPSHGAHLARSWGDPIQMVQDGANYVAAGAYGAGRTGRPTQVNVWEGVDRKRTGQQQRRPTADHLTSQTGVFAERGGALPGGVESLQREGKARAGSRYRRKRSRSSAITEQQTDGSLLGGGSGAGVLG
jgi:hypothetical protein